MPEFKFKIISQSSNEWSGYLQKSLVYDFYHTFFYHHLDTTGDPVMLIGETSKDFLALPFIIRRIKGSEYLDATSVYGYCGPIASKPIDEFSSSLIAFFKKEMIRFFNEKNIISVFSRLHPLIEQSNVFKNMGEITDLNKTVSIDLTKPPEEQRRAYRKSLKSELNQLRRAGFTVEEATTDEEIDCFISIYKATMDNLGASERYYFSREYFHSFIKNKEFEAKLLLAKFQGKIVAGAIFTIVSQIMQYHLAGTKEDFVRQAPMKLILDEARLLANDLNLQYLHLGGGVGGGDNDSLFRFKSGFSKNFHQFSIWKMIVDPEKYDLLVREKGLENSDDTFFPLYRLAEN